jgi:hypothetical protein
MLEQHYAGRLDRADREIARALDAAARLRHAGGEQDEARAAIGPYDLGFASSPNGI